MYVCMYSSYPYTYVRMYVCTTVPTVLPLYCYRHQITELTVNLKSARGKDRDVSSSKSRVPSSEWSEVIAAKDQELLQMKKKLSRMENQLRSVGVEKDKKTVSKLTKVEITYVYIRTYIHTYLCMCIALKSTVVCVDLCACTYIRCIQYICTTCVCTVYTHCQILLYTVFTAQYIHTYVRTYSSVTYCSCLCVHIHTYGAYIHYVCT